MSPVLTAQQRCRRRQAGTASTPPIVAAEPEAAAPSLAERELFSVNELAARSGFDASTLYRVIAEGQLAVIRLVARRRPEAEDRAARSASRDRIGRRSLRAIGRRPRTNSQRQRPRARSISSASCRAR